jgi:glycosyltransferase involved in cell wall biosynthesis
MPQLPLVTAIVTTHNRADLLPRALDSVVNQTYSFIELIVVDDGSKDNTEDVIRQYQDKADLVYIRNEQSIGACRARNKGIEAANGEFIAGLDDDDEWHKDRISELIDAYSDDYSCITSNTKMVYPRAEAIWKKKKVIDLNTLLFTNQVGNQVLVRRDRMLKAKGFDPHLVAAQDYDLWIRLCAAYGPIRNVQKPLQSVFMNHQENRITDQSSFKGYLQFYQKHKHRMNREQRKYQLYKIRRAQGKPEGVGEFLNYVPRQRYFKEVKRFIADWLWK